MITFSPAGRPLPGGYSVGRSPITGKWIVRRLGTIVSNTQPDDETAAAFARAHGELYPVPEIVDRDDDDPGPDNWASCPIRTQLRQHRHDAENRTDT